MSVLIAPYYFVFRRSCRVWFNVTRYVVFTGEIALQGYQCCSMSVAGLVRIPRQDDNSQLTKPIFSSGNNLVSVHTTSLFPIRNRQQESSCSSCVGSANKRNCFVAMTSEHHLIKSLPGRANLQIEISTSWIRTAGHGECRAASQLDLSLNLATTAVNTPMDPASNPRHWRKKPAFTLRQGQILKKQPK